MYTYTQHVSLCIPTLSMYLYVYLHSACTSAYISMYTQHLYLCIPTLSMYLNVHSACISMYTHPVSKDRHLPWPLFFPAHTAVLQWTPSHPKLPDTETADTLTKEGTVTRQDS